ncbi:MAG: TetR/AcrR family transcriptional regulator [Phycisphaerales bacterium]|nr:TetR/AcrR family transcriptional regulator [Phycisphaerales bacterium]
MPTLKVKLSKRELIISEASKLFREKGFGGSSMRDLAEKVGIEAASMYHHIRSKDEILEEICFEMAHRYEAQLSETEVQDISYPEKIEALIAFHVQLIIDNANAVSVVNNDWKYLSKERMIAFKSIRNDYEKRFAAIISKGIEAGAFKKVNISIALFTILSSLRWVELWYKPTRGVTKEDLAKDISAILMNGVKA